MAFNRPTPADPSSDRPRRTGNLIEDVRLRLSEPKGRIGAGLLLFACLVLLAGAVYWVILLKELPSVRQLEASRFEQATIVFTADGEELTRYHDKNRTWVGLDSISTHVTEALIATEDHRFYDHWGVDVRRTISSVFKTLGGDRQGGSTITMQFARNAFPDIADDWAYTRKLKEWLTALRLESMYEKDAILEMYLNTVPFMYNAFGIEAAAHTYFRKPAIDLEVVEAATLVGMLKGTVLYNPVRNPERSLERRNVVLQQMVARGYLQAGEAEQLAEQETPLDFRRITREDNLAPFFAEHLRQWLDEWAEANGYNPYTDGLRVHTTIDSELQAAAEAAVAEVGDGLQAVADVEWSGARIPYSAGSYGGYKQVRDRYDAFSYFWQTHPELLDAIVRRSAAFRRLTGGGLGADSAAARLRGDAAFMDSLKASQQRLEAGLLAMDPNTGEVKAWVGGRDFGEDQYDHVAVARRQPGSTFKPFVYAAAIERGFSPEDRFPDAVQTYVDPDTRRRWQPTNVGGASGEMMKLRDALAYSKNTITAQLITEVGPQRVADLAHRAGIESDLNPVPSLGLGTSEVTLLEMVTAYATLAGLGRYREPVFVTRIEDNTGTTIATFQSRSEEVLRPSTAYTVLDMMRGVAQYGTGVRIRNVFGVQGDLAAKTGTTQGGADGWFMLAHPEMVIGSWVGFNTQAITFRSSYWGQGAHNALYVVGNFARNAALSADARFNPPSGYVAPAPQDTLQFAGYDDYDDRLTRLADSLGRVTDSLLTRRDEPSEARGPLTYEDEDETLDGDPIDVEALSDQLARRERAAQGAGTPPPAGQQAEEAAETAEETPEEELSETDRLNRQERESNGVGAALERIRRNNGNGGNGNGNGNGGNDDDSGGGRS